jgi:hypothetical protein
VAIKRTQDPDPVPAPEPRQSERDRAKAWLEAMKAGRLTPPRDVHDARAWDTFWRNHLEVGPMEQGFSDMMSSDERLVGLLTRRGARTILCAGNGLSSEALSLAVHGFQVTALDLSPVACAGIAKSLHHPEHPIRQIPGFRVTDDGVVFEGSGPIPSQLCPKIHQSDDSAPRRGGSLRLVAGDLTVSEVHPGPFDVVIERRTVQLFPDGEQEAALDRLAGRLGARGTLVTHLHDGRGGPGRHRPHHAGEWSRSRGFVVADEVDEMTQRVAPRLVGLRLTTG